MSAGIPVIDVGALVGSRPGAAAACGRAMLEAARTVGFFYVAGHGIPPSLIGDVDRTARRFFALPAQRKEQSLPAAHHRGWLPIGEAKMYRGAAADLKESFVWGLDIGENDADYLAGNRMLGPNRWPAALPEMRSLFNAYFDAANRCGRMLLRAFAAALGVEEGYFDARFTKPVTRCTAVYYPPQPPATEEEQFGVAPHTDYGTLTLVHQDSAGGLEVRGAGGSWIPALPIEGTLVVNVGDLLARWTNDRFRSTPHRVINRSGRARLSIAAFVDPDFDTPIVPVVQAGETPRYPPVTCGAYILGRFDEAFAYRRGGRS